MKDAMKAASQRIQSLLRKLLTDSDSVRSAGSAKPGKKPLHDFSERKRQYYTGEIQAYLSTVSKAAAGSEHEKKIKDAVLAAREALAREDFDAVEKSIAVMLPFVASLVMKPQPKSAEASLDVVLRRLPAEIKGEVESDFAETRRCFDNGCHKAAVILCGRILEAALFRKYFDVTGKDLLATSPGTGLGKLIAKLKEKNVNFDPGITEQIHLINEVRVHSVHKKERHFQPTSEQAQAIMLFTVDVLNKLF